MAAKRKQRKKYSWRKGTRAPFSGQTFQKAIRPLGDEVTPEEVVNLATDKDSPIHKGFVWNNRVAGHLHRLEQARYYLRSVRVIVEVEDAPPKEEFVHIHVEDEDGSRYVATEIVAANESYIGYAMQECVRMLRGLRKRYHFLDGLNHIWKAVDKLEPPTERRVKKKKKPQRSAAKKKKKRKPKKK